jgi:serine/threonine protein kinase
VPVAQLVAEHTLCTLIDDLRCARVRRGTEFIKSPEMLVVANALQKQKDSYDRRKKVGANSASDIWSLGCLLFELITGTTNDTTKCSYYTTCTYTRDCNRPILVL